MWGDSESASKNTSIYVSKKFSEPLNKKFFKIRASDLVKAIYFGYKISLKKDSLCYEIKACSPSGNTEALRAHALSESPTKYIFLSKKTENYRGQTAPTALRNSRHSTVEDVRFKWLIRILIFCVSGFYSFGI